MSRALFFLTLLLAACSHKPVKLPEGGGLYPFGKYQHNVNIKTVSPAKSMEMRGIVSYSPDFVKVVGLSSFGTTVFRIDENLKTGEIKKEFYLEIIRQHQDRFMGFYQMIREIITAPKGSTDFRRGDAHFILTEPDENGVYCRIHVDHPQVILDVEVTDYE